MTTSTVELEPSTISDLVESLSVELKKVDLSEIKVHRIDPTRVRIETPVRRLAEYHFVSDAGHCSWKTAKGKIIVYLKAFLVAQRAEKRLFYIDLSAGNLENFVSPPHHGTRTSVRDIFITRSLRAVEGLKSLDEDKLREAVKAPTDYSVLVSALTSEPALKVVQGSDPLAAARLRGMEAKRRLLESEGGSISSTQAAKLLKVTRQAIDKRRKEGKLLGLELGKRGYVYPSWQFGLKGLEDVLSALGSEDFWEKLSFFLNPSDLLEDQTPLEALTEGKNTEDVVRAAKAYAEHGA
jgi:hypothetical protein